MTARAAAGLSEWDRTDVQGPDDLAAHRADEFVALARMAQALRSQGGQVLQRGVCASCAAPCAPQALYCDADCRADHEREMAALARAGRSARPACAGGLGGRA